MEKTLKERLKNPLIWLPLGLAAAFIIGLFAGARLFPRRNVSEGREKLERVLQLIETQYVDAVDIDSLLEAALPTLVSSLDPHSSYLEAEDLQEANDELNGSFSGIGISFQIVNDTVTVVEVLSGGPAEKVGLLAGDRIVTVNDSLAAGQGWTETKVRSTLRGPSGTTVTLGIRRQTSPETLNFTLERGDIPVTSIDASYILRPGTGYIKVNKFGSKTYSEFLNSLVQLTAAGATDFIVDLRGNGGGFMEPAILMANEFLGPGALIVSTMGRMPGYDSANYSDGTGGFTKAPLAVLIDEYSASASEIFAGAIQDNDRGTILGRRSFGKGLVQKQTDLGDGSALRLTVARYYTPSGRCIQKSYTPGRNADYSEELHDRFLRGELFSADSIRLDQTIVYHTLSGREVYGGGGIMPDIFVANDTSQITTYYLNVLNSGLFQKFAFEWADSNRSRLAGVKNVEQLRSLLPEDDHLLQMFVNYANDAGIAPRWYYINLSRQLIVNYLKALIARDALDVEAFYRIVNSNDKVVDRALEELSKTTTDK